MNNVIIGNFRALHHESHGGTKGTLRKRLLITYWVKDFFGQSKACILIMRRCFMQEIRFQSPFSHQCKIVHIQYEFTVSRPSINGALSFGLNTYNEFNYFLNHDVHAQ